METQRSFAEMNIWQRIFTEQWGAFTEGYAREHGQEVPWHWEENVKKMLGCGNIGEGYYEYYCEKCGTMKKVGVTCKSRLCLRCFKVAVDDWLEQVHGVLFEGGAQTDRIDGAEGYAWDNKRWRKVYESVHGCWGESGERIDRRVAAKEED